MITATNRTIQEVVSTMEELEALSTKPNLTQQEQRRNSWLLAKLASLRAGVSPTELKSFERDSVLKAAGFDRMPEQPRTRMDEDVQESYRDFLLGRETRTGHVPKDSEVRANEVGGPQSIGYTAKQQGGAFVPQGFWSRFSTVMKQADDIFLPWASNSLETLTGSPTPCPMVDDTNASSQLVGEGAQSTEIDIQDFGQIMLNAWTFRSGLVALSRELIQDSAFPLGPVVDNLMGLRHARGVGKYLISGNGSNQPLGLLPGIVAAAVSPVIAAGSGVNDGSSNTGANSIGTPDLNNCFFSVNAEYRRNAIWFMNDATLQAIAGQLDKVGRPLVNIVTGMDFVTDETKDFYFLMGKRVAICNDMPNIGSAANPIVFGDPNYFIFRQVPSSAYLQIFQEAGGTPRTFDLVLRDLVGLQSFFRCDSNVLIANSQQSPFGFIQCHS